MKFRKLVREQEKLFWVLHLGGWLAWGVLVKYSLTVAINDRLQNNIAYANRIAFFAVSGPRSDNRTLAGYSYVEHSWEIFP